MPRRKQPVPRISLFWSFADMREDGFVITLIRLTFFFDPCVMVLEINDTKIIVGDPSLRKRSISHEDFLRKWRKVDIVVETKTGN